MTAQTTQTLNDTQLRLLMAIANRKHGLAVEFQPLLSEQYVEALKHLLRNSLLERSGNTYFATPQAHILLEGALL